MTTWFLKSNYNNYINSIVNVGLFFGHPLSVNLKSQSNHEKIVIRRQKKDKLNSAFRMCKIP